MGRVDLETHCADSAGAPECDAQRRDATSTPHLQTIDIWSFGCVLSAVATWVVLGSQAYTAYDKIRQRAILELRRRHEADNSISVPTCGDAFHDGQKVLSAVADWHRHLRNSTRRSDTITHVVLDLIDDKMLIVDPRQRLTSEGLCKKLKHILATARIDYENAILDPDDLLTDETAQMLQMLLELDDEAPAVAKPQADIKKNASMEIREEDDGPDSATLIRGQRVKKPERMDKILIGKVANRAPVLKGLTTSASTREICESPKLISPVLNEPKINALEGQENGVDALGLFISDDAVRGQSPIKTVPTRDGTIKGDDARKYASQSPYTQAVSKNGYASAGIRPSSSAVHETAPHDDLVVSDCAQDCISEFNVPRMDMASHEQKHQSGSGLSELSTERHPLYEKSTQRFKENSPIQAADFPLSESCSGAVDPKMTAVYQEYDEQRRKWQNRDLISILKGNGPSADSQLKKFIYNRDIVCVIPRSSSKRFREEELTVILQIFVVDNAGTMKKHWPQVKTCLLALAMKIGRLDKDGLDLVFTIGQSRNQAGVMGTNIPEEFKKSMDKAGSEICDDDRTDMAATLGALFDAYVNTDKKQTLIILTDALWQGGNTLRSDVETSIREFTNGLNEKLKKLEKRWFTLQFISFGRDEHALKRLEDLDDKLGAK